MWYDNGESSRVLITLLVLYFSYTISKDNKTHTIQVIGQMLMLLQFD
jgi:hypothetical protein